MNDPPSTTTLRHPLRRFLKISLSTLLVVVALLAVWLAHITNRVRLQGQVFAELKALKCQVEFDYQHPELDPELRKRGARLTVQNRTKADPPGPLWLRKVVGDEYFRTLVWVSYYGRLAPYKRPGVDTSTLGPQHDDGLMRKLASLGRIKNLGLMWNDVTPKGLASVGRLAELHNLILKDCPNVSDEGIAHLQNLPQLEVVQLFGLPIADRSLASLAKLPKMRRLTLSNCAITDAGLESLRSAPMLEMLVVESPSLTDAGLAHLRGLANLTNLQVTSDKITDAGLDHVAKLANLDALVLRGAKVTDDGLARIEGLKELIILQIAPGGPPLTDRALAHLHGFSKLASLHLGDSKRSATQFTDEAILALVERLPKLQFFSLEPSNLKPDLVTQLKQARPGLRVYAAR